METILLQVNSLKAYKLIKDLEALDIVKVLIKSKNANKKAKLYINDFAGIWSKEEAAEIKNQAGSNLSIIQYCNELRSLNFERMLIIFIDI